MKKVKYNQYFKEASESLSKGAFLTVKNGQELNTMTIGWATTGIIWGKPILIVLVRESRYTYQLIENTDQFSVSFAFDNKMKEELTFCGTNSGRDCDKFNQCDLKTIEGVKNNTPLIGNCDLHYECDIVYKQNMDESNLVKSINSQSYPNDDYHTLYFGEIVNCLLEE